MPPKSEESRGAHSRGEVEGDAIDTGTARISAKAELITVTTSRSRIPNRRFSASVGVELAAGEEVGLVWPAATESPG